MEISLELKYVHSVSSVQIPFLSIHFTLLLRNYGSLQKEMEKIINNVVHANVSQALVFI